ncbi:MAG: hypothetical protein OXD42_10260, partial [Rhodospirillaceae bacterium]|nr:hypothetical protein [Rhodospirillaceae bacterium]
MIVAIGPSPRLLSYWWRIVAAYAIPCGEYTCGHACRPGASGGQPRRHGDERVQEVLEATLNRRSNKAPPWRVRRLSEEPGLRRDFIHRVWRAFVLYPDPPEKALVLCG